MIKALMATSQLCLAGTANADLLDRKKLLKLLPRKSAAIVRIDPGINAATLWKYGDAGRASEVNQARGRTQTIWPTVMPACHGCRASSLSARGPALERSGPGPRRGCARPFSSNKAGRLERRANASSNKQPATVVVCPLPSGASRLSRSWWRNACGAAAPQARGEPGIAPINLGAVGRELLREIKAVQGSVDARRSEQLR